ncbi:MAG: efflux RND transporter periplasmic adaptor subunit [Saprospirales bacterium]|nr:MAG: efflux RND transporter periplasmic adaptor subunit [Saprospirales bacterium]
MTKVIIIAIIGALFFLTGCSEDVPKGYERQDEAISVKTISPLVGADDHFSTSGRLQASQKTRLSTRIMGLINSIEVNEGDRISGGALAFTIQSSELDARLKQIDSRIETARVQLQEAERNFQRFARLLENQSATQREYEQAETAFKSASAGLENAKAARSEVLAQYEYTRIRAPFSGVVTRKFAEQGDIANPGMPVVEIERENGLEVLTLVPESRIGLVELNAPVEVELTSSGERVPGTIIQINPSSGDRSAQFEVKVALEQDFTNQFSGMFARVFFPVEETGTRLMIPREHLIRRGDLHGIYTVSQQNTAILRWLRLGKTSGDYVEVVSGLSEGDEYIVEAGSKLYNGALVELNR